MACRFYLKGYLSVTHDFPTSRDQRWVITSRTRRYLKLQRSLESRKVMTDTESPIRALNSTAVATYALHYIHAESI
jgi:hypothetical protein